MVDMLDMNGLLSWYIPHEVCFALSKLSLNQLRISQYQHQKLGLGEVKLTSNNFEMGHDHDI